MRPVILEKIHEGAERTLLGKNQSEHEVLPAAIDKKGLVLTEWKFTAEELSALMNGGRIRLWVHTFNHQFHPVSMEVCTDDGETVLDTSLHPNQHIASARDEPVVPAVLLTCPECGGTGCVEPEYSPELQRNEYPNNCQKCGGTGGVSWTT